MALRLRIGSVFLGLLLLIGAIANMGIAAAISVVSIDDMSVSPTGEPGDNESWSGSISSNGRYVVFASIASNIIPGFVYPQDPYFHEPASQIFVRDLQTNAVQAVSYADTGEYGVRSSFSPMISDDGRYVVFLSMANNLVSGVNPNINGSTVFIHDRQTNTTTHLALDDPAEQSALDPTSLSSDGNTILYRNGTGVYVYNRVSGTQVQVPIPNNFGGVSMTRDGKYVIFGSAVSGTSTTSLYRYNVATGAVEFLFSAYAETGTTVSDDANLIAYYQVTDPSPLKVYNVTTGETRTIDPDTNDWPNTTLSFSSDGRYLSYFAKTVDDPKGTGEAKIADLATNEILQVAPNVNRYDYFKLSANGDKLVFSSSNRDPGGVSRVYMATIAHDPPADTTAPVLGATSWTANPKTVTQGSTLTVNASDDTAVTRAEYFIGDTDPGQGNGATMQVNAGNVSADFGTDFQPGVYKVSVRAADAAGNWSDTVSDYLVVYNPVGYSIRGKKTVVPALSAGDNLPGLIANNQTDKATFGFTVKYDNQGVVASNSDLQFAYSTGSHCGNSSKAVNCHTLNLNATSVDWLIVNGTNNSQGLFQGTATVQVDGVTTSNPFRVTGLDGGRLNSTAADHFTLYIYAPDANPSSATPIHRVSQDVTRGNIIIKQ